MFADRLSHLRTKKKKTQQEMADAIGVTRPAYTAYESGNRKPDYETLNKIVDVLETNADYLLGRTDDPSPIKPSDFDEKEQTEFETFISNPEHGIFFKDYLSAPEERREEMRIIFKALMEKEKGRKPGDRQKN
ncbi:putative HTH-type transcriptional regulator YqaE [Paenibacillus faecis]|uniref:helix-turn-helix domain-containing protein n=1 Tax=Paenibacillus faecis TaxID=862114 RepID=UPI001B0501E0|nr:helix-turn-helix domain-containing protein [Paenibacillus faecis]GIO84592.1 putative HTH-type transcriptional regulator YqaE [Paenibacillus faecis]